ncbi:MAG: hypothetical protein Q4C60_00705 [Eubacteriales bacterium]|nr:hypothetical protein [Eubacteriales bacterium]
MSKGSREAAESAEARLCEWRGLNCYQYLMALLNFSIVFKNFMLYFLMALIAGFSSGGRKACCIISTF